MKKVRRIKKRLVLTMMVTFCLVGAPVMAIESASWLDKFAENHIVFFSPNGDDCQEDNTIKCVDSDGSDVVIVGDSLLDDAETKKLLKGKLTKIADTSYDAKVSRAWREGLEVLKKMTLKDVVLFALSTNDTGGLAQSDIDELVKIVGSERTIILMTPYSPDTAKYGAGYEKTKKLMEENAKQNSQIKIADWANAVKSSQSVKFDGMQIHPADTETKKLLVETLTTQVGGSCSGGKAVIAGSTAAEKVWSGLTSLGFTKEQAAGIMGNMAHESNTMNPAQHEGTMRTIHWKNGSFDLGGNPKISYGLGLIQWSFQRRIDIYNYIKEKAPDLLEHFNNPEKYSTAKGSKYGCNGDCYIKLVGEQTANRMYSLQLTFMHEEMHKNEYKGIFDQKTVYDATKFFLWDVEKPKDEAGKFPERLATAESFYTQFKNATLTGGSTGGLRETGARLEVPKLNVLSGLERKVAVANETSTDVTNTSESQSNNQVSNGAKEKINVVWNDGWIASGFDGYMKESLEDYKGPICDNSWKRGHETNRPKDGQMGANKITLHNLEGPLNESNGALHMYNLDRDNSDCKAGGGMLGFPPHFTIDLKHKRLFQHVSIDKQSNSIRTYDKYAGIQIEVAGLSQSHNYYKSNKNDSERLLKYFDKWHLYNESLFGDDEWKYLAKLIVAIGDYTGVPMKTSVDWEKPKRVSVEEFKNYEGIIGHMHTPLPNDHNDPGNMWPKLSKFINGYDVTSKTGGGKCGNGGNKSYDGDFPAWAQCDERWKDATYGKTNVCQSGCGPTSFAMMATMLTGTEYTPDVVARIATEKGAYVGGAKASGGYFTLAPHNLPLKIVDEFPGLVVEYIGQGGSGGGTVTIEELNKRLRDGWMFWTCGTGSEPFSGGGHCIGIRGITSEDKWLVADSGSRERAEKSKTQEWDAGHVFSMMRPIYGLKGN